MASAWAIIVLLFINCLFFTCEGSYITIYEDPLKGSFLQSEDISEALRDFEKAVEVLSTGEKEHLVKYLESGNYTEYELSGFPSNMDPVEDLLPTASVHSVTCESFKKCDRFHVCSHMCKRGSVEISPWLERAIDTQQTLALDLPITQSHRYGTHNSAITQMDGYGWRQDYYTRKLKLLKHSWEVKISNQFLSLTDQLRMGVRQIEIDVHWVSGRLRVCHAGGVHLDQLNHLIRRIAKIVGTKIDWDSETLGCTTSARSFAAALSELNEFLTAPGNENEVLVVMLDLQDDIVQWGKVGTLVAEITEAFGIEAVFTPPFKESHFEPGFAATTRWPTSRELINLNKRIMFTTGVDLGPDAANVAFYKYEQFGNWTEFKPIDLVRLQPKCTIFRAETEVEVQLEPQMVTRVLGDSLIYGSFYNGPKLTGMLTPANISEFLDCGVTYPCFDQVTPQLLEYAVWTWDADEPSPDANNLASACTVLLSSGRWASRDCGLQLPLACRSKDPLPGDILMYDWVPSPSKVPHPLRNGGSGLVDADRLCPPGFVFDVPRTAFMNSNARSSLLLDQDWDAVWLNYQSQPPVSQASTHDPRKESASLALISV
eukprot:Rmarinus@m.1377